MTKSKEKTFMFLRETKNGMVSDHFYMTENYENSILADFRQSAAEKVQIVEKRKNTEICLFYRDSEYNFCLGQIVRIKDDFCETEKEKGYRFIIIEIDPRQKRMIIESRTTDMIIKPCETVSMEMVEKV